MPRKPRRRRYSRSARRGPWATLLALVVLSAAGCGPEPPPPPPPDPAEQDAEFEGLSREEIELQAESMTPEEAERLGIVDTTIRIESPIHPDSVVHLDEQNEQHILPDTGIQQ